MRKDNKLAGNESQGEYKPAIEQIQTIYSPFTNINFFIRESTENGKYSVGTNFESSWQGGIKGTK